jgi:hypothetical protein
VGAEPEAHPLIFGEGAVSHEKRSLCHHQKRAYEPHSDTMLKICMIISTMGPDTARMLLKAPMTTSGGVGKLGFAFFAHDIID